MRLLRGSDSFCCSVSRMLAYGVGFGILQVAGESESTDSKSNVKVAWLGGEG